jgi:hypothetical protein
MAGGLLALLLGLALSAAFATRLEDLTLAIFMTVLVLAVLLPGYRAECWLGFVLGMAFTFGAAIPTVIGGIIAGLSALIRLGLVPATARGWAAFKGP